MRQLATGIITYLEDGKEYRWPIGCMAWETSEHLKKHLATWRPKAKFVSGEIVPDKKWQPVEQTPADAHKLPLPSVSLGVAPNGLK